MIHEQLSCIIPDKGARSSCLFHRDIKLCHMHMNMPSATVWSYSKSLFQLPEDINYMRRKVHYVYAHIEKLIS